MKKVFLLTFLCLFTLGFVAVIPVYAACDDFTCSNCETANVKVDLECQRQRFLNPCHYGDSGCCALLYCSTDGSTQSPTTKTTVNVNFFGVKYKIESGQEVASMIYLGFSMFLGLITLALVFLGLLGAYKRARAESSDDISDAQKILTNAVIGLVIVILSIVIVQLVGGFLGVPNITELVNFSCIFDPTCVG